MLHYVDLFCKAVYLVLTIVLCFFFLLCFCRMNLSFWYNFFFSASTFHVQGLLKALLYWFSWDIVCSRPTSTPVWSWCCCYDFHSFVFSTRHKLHSPPPLFVRTPMLCFFNKILATVIEAQLESFFIEGYDYIIPYLFAYKSRVEPWFLCYLSVPSPYTILVLSPFYPPIVVFTSPFLLCDLL